MLVQAKWDVTVGDRKLPSQITDMMARSDDVYVWLYGSADVVCAKASDVMKVGVPFRSFSVGELIVNGLRCSAGDRAIGRNLALPRGQAMRDQLSALRTPNGLSFAIVKKN